PAPAPPGSDVDLHDAAVVVDLFDQAAAALARHAGRRGSVIDLPARPAGGRLLMTGDLHDNGLNFQRILRLAGLHERTDRYLILHEVIHGPGRINGRDLSVRTLARAAALITQYPGQVLMLLANHDLAQLNGDGILKAGVSVVEAFDAGVDFLYDDRADDVRDAMARLIRAMPLAVRCPNGVMCCHSLPAPRKLERFDKTVLDRELTDDDRAGDGPASLMVWGRNHTQKVADELGEAWGAKLFVMGHQPADYGYEVEGETMIVLASDHEHGVALPIDLARATTRDELVMEVLPLGAVLM
ncbi:MAG: metallophosphoesterase, partial [Phycisphaeraceae bacterium]